MDLSLLVLLPLVTAIAILFGKGLKQVRVIALTGAILQLVLVIAVFMLYRGDQAVENTAGLMFQSRYDWFKSLNITLHVGVDGISIAMLLLTAFVVLAGVLVSWEVSFRSKEFFFLLTFLALGAYGFFISLDLFLMFFFLEVSVIPKFLLIGIWGSGKKEYSAFKLALMLMAGSALVMVGLLGVYMNASYTFDGPLLSMRNIDTHTQRIFFPFLFVGFGIFTALFPFHTWVPDGHSSAPTAASMFLAGISMKLGGYGCLRVATYLMPDAAMEYSGIIVVLATIAIIYGAFATLMQKDLKYINAYSSVSHCGFVLLGIGMLTQGAITGAVIQMVSHGLMTALFFAAIGMIYERSHTRMVQQLGGLMKVMPFICSVFVIAGLCSLGLPGFSGFVAEITVFMGSWQRVDTVYRIATILACSSLVVTTVYVLRAVGQSVMGPMPNQQFAGLKDARWNERSAAIILVAGIVAIGVAPFWLYELLAPGTKEIIDKIQMAAGII